MIEQERIGDWMQTYTGKQFFPLDPRIEDFDEADIAHALSQICRYGGHSNRFYSVAEHSVLMSKYFEDRDMKDAAFLALMHDSAEAYVGDMVRPLKQNMPEYRHAENKIVGYMALWLKSRDVRNWNITPVEEAVVHEADNRILLDEKAMLMGESPARWWTEDNYTPLGIQLYCWGPINAEATWLDAFYRLADIEDPR